MSHDGQVKRISAYKGNDSFVFVCYSHHDSPSVYSDLEQLDRHGIRFWYDEGIPGGTVWRAEIAAAIKNSAKFIFYISAGSLKSSHCLREVEYALDNNVDIVPVYLDGSSLPGELELVLNRVQALFKKSDSEYLGHLLEAVQKDSGFATRLPIKAKRRGRYGFPILLVIAGITAVLFWQSWNMPPGQQPAKSNTATAPEAYDRYLEGLTLMDRWDKQENLEKAISLFREAISLDPGFALAYARVANALRIHHVMTGDETSRDQAVENANEAARLNPNLAPVQLALGQVYSMQGNLDLAFAALERAISIDPNDPEINSSIARLYEKQGRLQDAGESFQRAVVLDPENPSSLNSYANFLHRHGRLQEAADEWRAVIELAPDHYAALVNLGAAFSDMGETEKAITIYEQAIKIQPSAIVYANLGTAHFYERQFREAMEAYHKAIEIDDSVWFYWGNLADTYSKLGGMESQASAAYEHAIQLAESARKQQPRDPFVHSDLAYYYAETSQPELALQRLGTALTIAPESGEVLVVAALVHLELGHRDKASKFTQEALEHGYAMEKIDLYPELASLLSP